MNCKHCKRQIADNSIYCNWCGTAQIKTPGLSVPEPRLLKSGSWNIQLRAEGLSVTESTREACISRAEELRRDFLSKSAAANITVAEAVKSYIESREGVLSPSTVRGYMVIARNRFKPEMGRKLSEPINWQASVSREAGEVSAKTVKNAWGLMQSVLSENGINTPSVKLPQSAKPDTPWLSYKDLPLFLSCLEGSDIELACLLALHSLRRSEIYALTPESIDLSAEVIHVRGAIVPNTANKFVYKTENKTEKSRRDIPFLIPRLAVVARAFKASGGPICPFHPNTLCRKIDRLCKDHELPAIGIHGLRRSFASLAYHLGWSERETMAIGGWSDMNIMHKFYIKLTEADKSKAAKTMNTFYKKKFDC